MIKIYLPFTFHKTSSARKVFQYFTCFILLLISHSSLCAQILTISATGESGTTSGSGWSISGSLMSVTSDANVQASVIASALSGGALTIEASSIIIDENITSTTANTLTLKALENITLKTTRTLQTNGGAIIFWSDADNTQSGDGLGADEIYLEAQTTINTQGGALVLAGGLDDGYNGGIVGDGIPDNYAYRGSGNSIGGVNLGPAGGTGAVVSLTTAGGNITIRGKTANTATDARPGVTSQGNLAINAGSGRINIEGISSVSNGVEFGFAATISMAISSSYSGSDPAIRIAGGSSVDKAVYLSRSSSSGNILIQSAAATGGGLLFEGSTTSSTLDAIATNVSGSSTNVRLLSGSGNITFTTAAVGPFSTALGALRIYGVVRFGVRTNSTSVQGITPSVTSSNANVILRGNSVDFDPNQAITSASTGSFTVAPRLEDNSFTSAITIRRLSFTAVTGIRNSSFTVGRSTNTTDITFASTNSVSIPGTITVHAGVLSLDGDLTSTAASGTGVSLNAIKFLQNAASDVTTSGANINYTVTNSPFTVDADIAMALGPSTGTKATINAGGGNINFTASFSSTGVNNSPLTTVKTDIAIYTKNIDIATSGNGSISFNGDAFEITNTNGSAAQQANGVQFADNTLVTTVNGAITITGRGGKSNSSNRAIAIDINTVKILSASGDILFDGRIANSSWTFNQTVVLGHTCSIGADDVVQTSSTSNITLKGNGLVFSNSPKFKTTGALVFESEGSSFVSTLGYAPSTLIWQINLSATPSSLRIGKSTNTMNVNVNNQTIVSGPISIYGATLNINNILTATNSTVTLQASTAITQNASGNITANGLALTGTGSANLPNANNSIITFAAGASASRIGAINFNNNKALTIGTVNPTGVYSSGLIEISTTSGDISITEPLSSSLASGDAVKLYADKDATSGTLGDGNVTISGNGTISIESGARAMVYSGNELLSTGLTSEVGGVSNTRTNVDATTDLSTVTPAIGTTGEFAFYRTEPSALPVVWYDFKAVIQNESVLLTWQTASEQNTKDFVVQHSSGTGWFEIGKIIAAGNSNQLTTYTFRHDFPLIGNNLYRLLQRDLDGKESFSKVIRVNLDKFNNRFVVYPTLVSNGSVHIRLPESEKISMYDGNGRLVLVKNGVKGTQILSISHLTKGQYFIKAGNQTSKIILH